MLKRIFFAAFIVVLVVVGVILWGVGKANAPAPQSEEPSTELPEASVPEQAAASSASSWQPPINFKGEIQLTYAAEMRGSVITPPRPLADFSVPATTGEDFTLSQQRGQILLVYFGYMTCPDVCPNTLAEMLRAYREIGEPKERVKVVFITLDPERDTLERLTRFMQAFSPDFIGLRPESDGQLEALKDEFGVVSEKREVDSALGYTIDHSATTWLIGPDGKLIAQYPYGVPYTEMANDVQVVMKYTLPPDQVRTISVGGAVTTNDPAREYRIVIPEGSGAKIMMGEDPGVIPLKIELTLGVKDVLVLENHDNSDYLVGGIWVAPYETVRKQFYEPQTFIGLCTVTVGRDLVEITVREP